MKLLRGDLFKFITQDSAISALIGTRCYPALLPQSVTYPAISFGQVSRVSVRDLSGPAGKARTRIQIDCWASTQDEVRLLADAVRALLDGYDGYIFDTHTEAVRLDNEIDLFESEAGRVGVYRVSQDYIIAHLES